jgi:hypothetical protein
MLLAGPANMMVEGERKLASESQELCVPTWSSYAAAISCHARRTTGTVREPLSDAQRTCIMLFDVMDVVLEC